MRRTVSHRPHLHRPHCSTSWPEPSATLRANSRHSPPRYTHRERRAPGPQNSADERLSRIDSIQPPLFPTDLLGRSIALGFWESIARIEAWPHLENCPPERRFQAITSDGPEPLSGSARTALGQTAQLPPCRRRRRSRHHRHLAVIPTLVELLRRRRHARRTHRSAQPRGWQRVALTGSSTPQGGRIRPLSWCKVNTVFLRRPPSGSVLDQARMRGVGLVTVGWVSMNGEGCLR